jgi:hypothetical protein
MDTALETGRPRGRMRTRSRAAASEVWRSPWARFTTAGLGSLLAFLLIREAIEPGFTDYWGFMIAQIAGTLAAMIALTIWFAPQGGLSWYTHLLVTANTWADTFGTAGHLYERHASYDKVTHFLAGVAITGATADILRALDARGTLRLPLRRRLQLAVTLTLLLNIGWETYEYLGDVVFHSERHRGSLDTAYDLLSDVTGALLVSLLLSLACSRKQAAVAAVPSRSSCPI